MSKPKCNTFKVCPKDEKTFEVIKGANTTITTDDIKQYIKYLDIYFVAYNGNPITSILKTELVEKGLKEATDVLYYWLFVNIWKKNNFKENNVYILTQIHDMWALNLFVEHYEEGGVVKLKYKNAGTNGDSLDNFTNITVKAGPLPKKDEWYKGDLISCEYNKKSIKDNILDNKDDFSKNKITFPHIINDGIMLEFRRISQLIPFNMLTEPCKEQDKPFWDKNVKVFTEISNSKGGSFKITADRVMLGGRNAVVYNGPRGGKYVKKSGEYVKLARIIKK